MERKYVLYFSEGFLFQGDPEPVILSAVDDRDAIECAGVTLDIEDEVTPENFRAAGGKEILCFIKDEKKVFPADDSKGEATLKQVLATYDQARLKSLGEHGVALESGLGQAASFNINARYASESLRLAEECIEAIRKLVS